ncbi:MAG: hypothetical protein HOG85_02665 [Flavobacteriales bacterium]|nr:hypothetical protein [Flavobacteriales bacterium]MBT7481531.1 hypothetical protein [Flavobacteriales bacterium]
MFTLSNLLNQFLENNSIRTDNRQKKEVKPREKSIKFLLDYSKSVKSIKTNSLGEVLIVNN